MQNTSGNNSTRPGKEPVPPKKHLMVLKRRIEHLTQRIKNSPKHPHYDLAERAALVYAVSFLEEWSDLGEDDE